MTRKQRRLATHRDDDVRPAVVIEIADGQPSRRVVLLESRSGAPLPYR